MRKEQKVTKRCFATPTFHLGRRFGLASVALLCALVPVALTHAQTPNPDQPTLPGETNRIRALTNAVLFPQSVVVTNPPTTLPQQGPWEFSSDDVKAANTLLDLVELRSLPKYAFLWSHLSRETQQRMLAKYSEVNKPYGSYTPGPEIEALVGDLNALVQTNTLTLLSEYIISEEELSADTWILMNRISSEANNARLNRLFLEDVFSQDVFRRPKILLDPGSQGLLLIDFRGRSLSLYTQAGSNVWSQDLPQVIAESEGSHDPNTDLVTASLGKDVVMLRVQSRGDLSLNIALDKKSGRVISAYRL